MRGPKSHVKTCHPWLPLVCWSDWLVEEQQPTGFNFLLLYKTLRQARRVQQQSTAIEVVKGHLHDIGTDLNIHRGKVNPFNVRRELEAGSTEMPWLIFHPYSTWRLGWDVLIMCLLLYSLIAVPVRIAFEDMQCSNNFYDQTLFWYIDLGLDCCFIMDVFISFRTAFVDVSENAETKLVTSPSAIAKKYGRGFLFIDIISSVPFDLILLVVNCDTVNGANRILRSPKALKIIRLVRLLRISRLQVFLRKVNDMLQINPGLLRLLYFIFLVCLAFHYNSCIFFFIGEYFAEDADGTEQPTWIVDSKTISAFTNEGEDVYAVRELEPWQQYLMSLYWTVTTMTTVGWGDVTPHTTPEVAFTLLVLLQGGATFSYMVGNMATLISRISPRTLKYRAREEVWENFFHREGIAHEMRRRIRNYEAYMYREPLGNLPDFARKELSGSLLREITGHIYSKALHTLKIFKGLDEYCLTHLALALKPVQLPPGEVIYKEGDYGNCMFFLHTGEVEFSMLLMAEAEKVKLNVKNVGDTAFTDSFIKRNQRRASTDEASGTRRAFHFTRIATAWKTLGTRKVQLQHFSWRMNADNKHTCFGESVLTSTSGVRLSTATTTTWTVLFMLDRDKLREVVNRIPAMKVVWANIKKHRTSRLVRAVSRVVQSMRTRYNDTGRLYVEVQKGVNLPRTDGFLGKCDGFCTLQRDGADVEDKRVFHTRVQYSTFSPVWDETFFFPVQEGRGGANVKIKISLYDHNMIGQHEFIGFALLDATELCWSAFDDDVQLSESRWLTLRKMSSNGVPLPVKGTSGKGKNSLTKVKVGLRAIPPPADAEAAGGEKMRRRTTANVERGPRVGFSGDGDATVEEAAAGDVEEEKGEREGGRRVQFEASEGADARRRLQGWSDDAGSESPASSHPDSRGNDSPGKRVLFDMSDSAKERPEPGAHRNGQREGRGEPATQDRDLWGADSVDFSRAESDFSRCESNASAESADSSRSEDLLSTKGLRTGTAEMLRAGPNGTDSGLLLLCGVSETTGGSLFCFDNANSAPLQEEVGEEWWQRVLPRAKEGEEANPYRQVLEAVLRAQHRERSEVEEQMAAMARRLHDMEEQLRSARRAQRKPKPLLLDDPDQDPAAPPPSAHLLAAPAAASSRARSPRVAIRDSTEPRRLAPLMPLPPKLPTKRRRSRDRPRAPKDAFPPDATSAHPRLNGSEEQGVPRDALRVSPRSATPRSRYQPPPPPGTPATAS